MQPITKKDYAYDNAKKAFRFLGYTIQQTIPINKGRYRIIQTDKKNALLVFKSDVFNTFKDVSGKNTVGETINKLDFAIALSRNCDFIMRVTDTGNILITSMYEFYVNSHTWTNKEGKEVLSADINIFKNVIDYIKEDI